MQLKHCFLLLLSLALIALGYAKANDVAISQEIVRRKDSYSGFKKGVDMYSYRYCVGSWLLRYKAVKPIEEYDARDRKFIISWIIFKCTGGDDRQ